METLSLDTMSTLTSQDRQAAKRDASLAAAKSAPTEIHQMADQVARTVKSRHAMARFSANDALEVLAAIGRMLAEEA